MGLTQRCWPSGRRVRSRHSALEEEPAGLEDAAVARRKSMLGGLGWVLRGAVGRWDAWERQTDHGIGEA